MPNGEIKLTWGDGEHKFNIAVLEQVLELEEKCNAGIGVILGRLRAGTFYFNDFRETMRLGLIGAGMDPAAALRLIVRYVDRRPWHESVLPAQAILGAAMVGVPGDNDVGKKPVAERTETEAAATALSAPPSTASAPPSDSPLGSSTSSPFGSSPPVSTATTAPTA